MARLKSYMKILNSPTTVEAAASNQVLALHLVVVSQLVQLVRLAAAADRN